MIRQTGVDGVTVARGAIGNPWIFRKRGLWRRARRCRRRPAYSSSARSCWSTFGWPKSFMAVSEPARICGNLASSTPPCTRSISCVREAFTKVRNIDDWRTAVERGTPETCRVAIPIPRSTAAATVKKPRSRSLCENWLDDVPADVR